MGLRRHPLTLRHSLMCHHIQRPTPDPHLSCLLSHPPARYTAPEEHLHPEHRRLTQRATVIPRLFLPRRTTDPPDAAQILIPGQPRTGRLAMPLDRCITPRRDHRTCPTPLHRLVHRTTVVHPVRPHTSHRVVHRLQQRGDRLRIGHPRLAHDC